MSVRWLSWCPGIAEYDRRDIIRLIAISAYKLSNTARSPDILDLDTKSWNVQVNRRSSRLDDNDPTDDDSDDHAEERSAKKLKTAPSKVTWETHTGLIRPLGPDGRFLPRNSVTARAHSSNGATTATAPRQAFKYLVREPQMKEPPLTVVLKDSSGTIQGSYPYDECNTAEKLFDVACVSRIALIEPPSTRLLKVEFEGGVDGCIRPDNVGDYDKVFKAELKRLMDAVPSTTELKVTVRPYR